MSRNFEYNLIVLGAGSGGLVAAYLAASFRAKVALIEKDKMGGDCLNTGCVPSKALIRSTRVLSLAKRAQEFGLRSGKFEFEFSEVMERVQRVIHEVEPHDSVERYRRLGVDCFFGQARILSPYEVQLGERILTARAMIVATGGHPAIPKIPGLDRVRYFTSDTIWGLRACPTRFVVVGGGPVGCELAQCFSRLGSQVTIVHHGNQILPKEDPDAAGLLQAHLAKEGVRILLNADPLEFQTGPERNALRVKTSEGEVTLPFDEVLIAVGRKANTTGFGLEELGVRLSKTGTIVADPFLRTNYPNIFACGDVTGPYQFTHFAGYQAGFASLNALFSPLKKFKVDESVIPWCTFTEPEVARVGLNETEARSNGTPYEVSVYHLRDLDRAIAEGEAYGFVKVLTIPRKDRILGVTIVGEGAGESLAEYVAAIKNGIGLKTILSTIHVYPTLSEANRNVAGIWRQKHISSRALRLLEKFHAWRRAS